MTFDFKSGSPVERKREYDRIATEIGDTQFFTKKELNHIPEILSDGEQVLAFTSGMMDGNTWLITLTDRRIIFLDKGMFVGLRQTTIDLDKVNSISGKTGFFLGSIAIADGATTRQIDNVWKKTVVTFTNKVRDAIEARKALSRPQLQLTQESNQDSVVSQLERLAALLDKGVLTQAEFAQQKARLLV